MAIYMVQKLTSDQLMTRLKDKGTRNKEFTQEMIRKKLVDDGDDIATTDIKVSLILTTQSSVGNQPRAGRLAIALMFVSFLRASKIAG